jgi:hypothetical protein
MQSEFTFTTPFNVRVEKKGDLEEIHLDGFISTTDRDLVDDIVTKDCLESMKRQILDRNLKLDIEHEAFRGNSNEEKEINKSKVPAGRMYDATVETIGSSRFGLRVKSVINNFRKDFEQIKGNVINKFLDAYSIAFLPTKTSYKDIEGKKVRLLDDVVLLNVAMTGNPINTTAQNREIFMKAISSIDEYKSEKKLNPGIENDLNVKSKLDGEPDEGEPEEDEEDKKKKKKNNNHKSDNQLNQGGKIMDTKDENQEETQSEEESENKPEENSQEESEEETKDESEESEEENEETKALKAKINSLESDVAELKAMLKAPVHKARAEQRPKQAITKSMGPLDHL